jgi:hypothetical protein
MKGQASAVAKPTDVLTMASGISDLTRNGAGVSVTVTRPSSQAPGLRENDFTGCSALV